MIRFHPAIIKSMTSSSAHKHRLLVQLWQRGPGGVSVCSFTGAEQLHQRHRHRAHREGQGEKPAASCLVPGGSSTATNLWVGCCQIRTAEQSDTFPTILFSALRSFKSEARGCEEPKNRSRVPPNQERKKTPLPPFRS